MVVDYANYLHARGHDVVLETGSLNTAYRVNVPVRIVGFTGSKFGTIVDALFRRRSYDVIIGDIIASAFFLAFRNRSKVIYFAQDDNVTYYANVFLRLLTRLLYFCALRIQKIPVIAVSPELEARLTPLAGQPRLAVVPNGIDRDLFFPDRDEAFVSLKGQAKVILVFAQEHRRKGFDIAIRALILLQDQIESGKILIWSVGESLDAPFPMKRFGFVPPEVLRKVLTASDVFFYPSRYEGFGLLALEAMACGCPVVLSEAFPSAISGESAIKCRMEDAEGYATALRMILSDSALRGRIIDKGHALARQYSLDQSRREFESQVKQFACINNHH